MSHGGRIFPLNEEQIVETLRADVEAVESSRRERMLVKFILAAVGQIPWVGAVLSLMQAFKADETAINQLSGLQEQWLEEHGRKIRLLEETITEIGHRLSNIGGDIDERLQSEDYLALVRKAFRVWDEADSDKKRRMLSNVLTNAAGTRAASDDVVRLFIEWIRAYNEVHFAVIGEISSNPGATRYDIWVELYNAIPREDSSEADLYKFLIRELSTGGVIRQTRDTNEAGQYVRKRAAHVRRGQASRLLESAFEDTKTYVLTALGKQFVHYTMNELVTRLDNGEGPEANVEQ